MTELILEFINSDINSVKTGLYKNIIKDMEKIPKTEIHFASMPSLELDVSQSNLSTLSNNTSTPRDLGSIATTIYSYDKGDSVQTVSTMNETRETKFQSSNSNEESKDSPEKKTEDKR